MTQFDRNYAFDRVLLELHQAKDRLDRTIEFLEEEKLRRDRDSRTPGLSMAAIGRPAGRFADAHKGIAASTVTKETSGGGSWENPYAVE